jgi:hypothetical protein
MSTKSYKSVVKTLKASRISSSESVSFIFLAIRVRNSGKSMVPLPSASTCGKRQNQRSCHIMTLASEHVDYDLVDHILELSLSWVLSQGSHNGTQLLGSDRAC